MLINEELFVLEQQCEQIIEKIRSSRAMKEFEAAKIQLASSPSAQEKISTFRIAKEKFAQIEAYGTYAPDYATLRQELFQAKREMDLDSFVYEYRIRERNLQVQLDLIAKKIASAVSDEILVSAGDAFSLSVIGLPTACEIHLGNRKDIEL